MTGVFYNIYFYYCTYVLANSPLVDIGPVTNIH